MGPPCCTSQSVQEDQPIEVHASIHFLDRHSEATSDRDIAQELTIKNVL